MGTGCRSAGSSSAVADRPLRGVGVQRSCCPLLLALELKLELGQGRGLSVGRGFGNSLNRRERNWWLGMLLGERVVISLRCCLRLGQVRCGRLRVRFGLRLLLHLDLRRRMVLELWGGCAVLTEATGLSCTVDLTQRVQRLTLSVLQQVGLALRQRETERDGERRGETEKQRRLC